MMAIPTMACYRCITANDNKIAKCIGAPACVAATFTSEIMGAGMATIVNTVCQGLCTASCSPSDISVIEEKQAVLDGGCTARGTPVASTCPPPPPPPPTPPPPTPTPPPATPAPSPPPPSSATSLTVTSTRPAQTRCCKHWIVLKVSTVCMTGSDKVRGAILCRLAAGPLHRQDGVVRRGRVLRNHG